MANTRDIKNRIDSVKSTRQITNAMKMVAAAKLRRSQEKILAARPYADNINKMLRKLKLKNKFTEHQLLYPNQDAARNAFVFVTSDRGLCGGFNSMISKRALIYLEEHKNTDIICIGKKGYDYIRQHTNLEITEKYFNFFNEMDFSISKQIADDLLKKFLKGDYGKIDILYNEFKSAIQQNIITKQLLPIVPAENEEISTLDFIYEPDDNTIISELGEKYIEVEIWRIMLESSAAEQGARMTAMDSATDNADELVEELTLKYNQVRQSSITKEIIEISSGAEALK
ncbi:MAG TPA: ATP synthase F1 subunit gamma [Candidatus Cloacimonas sp.]|jgi:F-type H+-transporting ATPase subunit gamma|nr:F-type H+-transporting ATPase subunit gamma [Candidatus Cloacimonadota bacterium]HCX72887.1 ATP synthase F1 subunit gamma [Candidatus Cloacimonas sp.]